MNAQATVGVRYFASLREALGADETLTLAGAPTVGAVRDALLARTPRHADLLARGRAVRAAPTQPLSDQSTVVGDGAEVAFFPPVTGG